VEFAQVKETLFPLLRVAGVVLLLLGNIFFWLFLIFLLGWGVFLKFITRRYELVSVQLSLVDYCTLRVVETLGQHFKSSLSAQTILLVFSDQLSTLLGSGGSLSSCLNISGVYSFILLLVLLIKLNTSNSKCDITFKIFDLRCLPTVSVSLHRAESE
jgi:hypothetical protein